MVLAGVFVVGLVGVLAEPVPDSVPDVPDTLEADVEVEAEADVEADAEAAVDGPSGEQNDRVGGYHWMFMV